MSGLWEAVVFHIVWSEGGIFARVQLIRTLKVVIEQAILYMNQISQGFFLNCEILCLL